MKNNTPTLQSALPISSSQIYHNLPFPVLQELLVNSGEATLTESGALMIQTGKFTGRAPKDKFIVKDSITQDTVDWGGFNNPFDSDSFDSLHKKMLAFFEGRPVYVRDVYACADTRYRIKIRTFAEKPWSDLFVRNMFIAPSAQELENFEPDWTLFCAPSFQADPAVDQTRQSNFSIIDFSRKILLVGGTGYTGEIKKGIFTVLNFTLPHFHKALSMHCSANIGAELGDTALFFGLSGTGKTTLSADPDRKLIGDDEHGWTDDDTIFNFEGGCYAKTINITREKEPDIFDAIRSGALLENGVCKSGTNQVDYTNDSITENTRVSYPLNHIRNAVIPSLGTAPDNIFFLTCDAYGVLPPISKLTPGQAAFHFISGYTAKVAGTEAGITEPTTTFSACFGAPFIPLHPTQYAEMLISKIRSAGVHVWLVNTGWSGGSYGVGKRISLPHTRALIKAVLDGNLLQVLYTQEPFFGLQIPTSCPGVPSEMLNPKNTWPDQQAYDRKATELAASFMKNFEKFSAFANQEIWDGGPKVR